MFIVLHATSPPSVAIGRNSRTPNGADGSPEVLAKMLGGANQHHGLGTMCHVTVRNSATQRVPPKPPRIKGRRVGPENQAHDGSPPSTAPSALPSPAIIHIRHSPHCPIIMLSRMWLRQTHMSYGLIGLCRFGFHFGLALVPWALTGAVWDFRYLLRLWQSDCRFLGFAWCLGVRSPGEQLWRRVVWSPACVGSGSHLGP